MTTFWMLAVSLTAVALAFSIPPLFRSARARHLDRNELNAEVIKDQLKELRADLETGKLDKEAYQAARQDLERELLNDLDDEATVADKAPRSGRWLAALLLLAIPGLAFLTYQLLGEPRIIPALTQLADTPTQQPQARGSQKQDHSMQEMVARLEKRLSQQPDNVDGWVLLARSYASLQRYQQAADAYAEAYRLRADSVGLITDYADMLVTANGGQFTDQVGVLLDEALALQPDHVKALWLQGHWKYRRADYAGALGNWQRVAAVLPPGDENIATINQQIEQAKNLLAEKGIVLAAADETAGNDSAQPPAAGSQIHVQVSLDPALSEKVAAEDTVFIFARAAVGPKMPLAIVRKQVKDLPVTVTLDDSLAMSPAMVLSKFPEVTVGARISKSGQAMPQSGDLQGTVTPVSTSGDASIELNIDSAIP
jgi:cytochrome c-type biogenesis protein CcmH